MQKGPFIGIEEFPLEDLHQLDQKALLEENHLLGDKLLLAESCFLAEDKIEAQFHFQLKTTSYILRKDQNRLWIATIRWISSSKYT